jgi:hypothetical protein
MQDLLRILQHSVVLYLRGEIIQRSANVQRNQIELH